MTAATAALVACVVALTALVLYQDSLHLAVSFFAMVALFPLALLAALYLLWRLRRHVGH